MLVALRFMTRLPAPAVSYEPDSLSRAVKFFPLIGLLVAAGAMGLNRMLSGHTGRGIIALVVLGCLVLIKGGLHEDGLADAGDGLGGCRNRNQVLASSR